MVYLVGFTIELYYDARSYERQTNAKNVHSAARERRTYPHARLLEQNVPLHADSNTRSVTSHRFFQDNKKTELKTLGYFGTKNKFIKPQSSLMAMQEVSELFHPA